MAGLWIHLSSHPGSCCPPALSIPQKALSVCGVPSSSCCVRGLALDSKKSIQDPGVPARLVIRCDGPLSFLWRHTAIPFFGRQDGSRFEQTVRRASRLFSAQEGSLLIINFSELSSIISCFSCQLGYFRRFSVLEPCGSFLCHADLP